MLWMVDRCIRRGQSPSIPRRIRRRFSSPTLLTTAFSGGEMPPNSANGAKADLILGQLDEQSTERLGPGTARSLGFSTPGALAIDSKGSLYVVDTATIASCGFRKPFESTRRSRSPIWSSGSRISRSGMPTTEESPRPFRWLRLDAGYRGFGIRRKGNLWFSDSLNNRVVRYPRAALDAGERPCRRPGPRPAGFQNEYRARTPERRNRV